MGEHPGIRLREELKNRHVSARAAAHAMGIPANRLTEIIRGRRDISLDTAFRIALYLGQSVDTWYIGQAAFDIERFDVERVRQEVHPWREGE